MLASPNIAWATFPYNQLLAQVEPGVDGATIGERWLDIETNLLEDEPQTITPFVLSLIDLTQMDTLALATQNLATALQAIVSEDAQKQLIGQAFDATDRYESNNDEKLNLDDGYSDLADFATQLTQRVTDTQVVEAAHAVTTALTSAVVSVTYQSGTAQLPNNPQWAWQNPGGLSIYLPLRKDEARRSGYTAKHVAWAGDTQWADFLIDYLGVPGVEPEICQTTANCSEVPSPLSLPGLQLLEGPTLSTKSLVVGEELSVTALLKNNSDTALDLIHLTYATRGPNCASRNCPKRKAIVNQKDLVVGAGETYTLTGSVVLWETGTYFSFLHYTDRAGNWKTLGGDTFFTVTPGIEFTEPLSPTVRQPQMGEIFSLQAQMTNLSNQPIELSPLSIAGRGPDCTNWVCENNPDKHIDVHLASRTLQPGEVYNVDTEKLLVEPGSYFFQLSTKDANGTWHHFGNKLELEIFDNAPPLSQRKIYLPLIHK